MAEYQPEDTGRCPACGKIRYFTRRGAKAAARRAHPGDHGLRPYQCGTYWHYGHMDPRVARGEITKQFRYMRRY